MTSVNQQIQFQLDRLFRIDDSGHNKDVVRRLELLILVAAMMHKNGIGGTSSGEQACALLLSDPGSLSNQDQPAQTKKKQYPW